MRDKYSIDSKAFLVQLICRIPYMLLIAVAGAVLGSGLYLLIMVVNTRTTMYESETEYYINFADGVIEAKDWYNAFTWNDVLKTDYILGKMMETLGSDYDREETGEMLSAQMLSDIRYLTVFVRNTNPNKVNEVSKALKEALESFPSEEEIDEFESISQIENNGVKEIKNDYFTWRAALLGALVFLLFWLFDESVRFSVGSRFYTRTDVTKWLGVPTFGIRYKGNTLDDNQERQIVGHLAAVGYSMDRVVFLSVENNNNIYYEKLREKDGVVLLVPFGVDCKEITLDIIQNLSIQDINIIGVILTEVDRKWYKLYMGALSKL